MISILKENLRRQHKALLLLEELLGEEYTLLRGGHPRLVVAVEQALQELMRQLTVERKEIRRLVAAIAPPAKRLSQLLERLPLDEAVQIEKLVILVDAAEKACARQGVKNRRLADGLMEQSRSLMSFFMAEACPKDMGTYSRRGAYRQVTPPPSLIDGRL